MTNPLVAEIRAQLEAVDSTVDDTIAFVLAAAAKKIRAWGEEGHLRLAEDENGYPVHRSPFYMWEDADAAANLIDPEG